MRLDQIQNITFWSEE